MAQLVFFLSQRIEKKVPLKCASIKDNYHRNAMDTDRRGSDLVAEIITNKV